MLAEYVVPALQVLLEHGKKTQRVYDNHDIGYVFAVCCVESLLEKRAQAESMLADCEARIESRNNLRQTRAFDDDAVVVVVFIFYGLLVCKETMEERCARNS